ncbi:MFS transporter [Tunturiibacter empetritectus]|uniref:EmrB/QacA subfamily drug resistance transporter n=1 Tax=Tunturiibacter lichenicola TaxID=2051959 RepID=A0A852V9F5_9BACT|nr:MFS transporter [Edaphobacter lichenicola]NYF87961.1 EmrB/QacA subfamily drug resistance transporter [Edaphobacter lichenicola]
MPLASGDADRGPITNGAWVLLAAILGSSMAFIDGTVINVALPALQSAFHASGPSLQWIVEAYALSLSSLLLLGGSFGDLYGRRKSFLLGVVIFATASMVCGIATTPLVLIVSRALQGIGGSLLVPGSLALISASFPEKSRGNAIGIWSGSTAVTASVGPLFGGWLIQHASWRYIFFLNVPIALLVVVVCLAKVPESRNPLSTRPDWLGALLAATGLGLCTFALVEGSDPSSRHPLLLALGATLLFLFVLWQREADFPMMPLDVFRSRSFGLANVITFLTYAALSGALYYLPLQLIQVQGYTAAQAGGVLVPMTVLIAVLSRWTGGLVLKMGQALPLGLGSLLSSIGYALLLRLKPNGSYWGTILPGVLFLGLGLAVMVAPLTTTVMNSVSQDRTGTASGINNAVSSVASLLAIAVCGIVFSVSFTEHLQRSLSTSSLPHEVQQHIFDHRKDLGGIVVSVPNARSLVNDAFEESLHRVLLLCCLLSISAAIAATFLRSSASQQTHSG